MTEIERTKQRTQVCSIISKRHLVISRGEREGVEVDEFYAIPAAGSHLHALFRVTEVREKMAFVETVWVGESCPDVKYGTWLHLIQLDARGEA